MNGGDALTGDMPHPFPIDREDGWRTGIWEGREIKLVLME